MIFTVKFVDGDVREIPYSLDIFNSIPYEEFCRAKPYLHHLIHSSTEATRFVKDTIKTFSWTGYQTNQEVYLDIRLYGDLWFDDLNLPDTSQMTYVSRFLITKCAKISLHMINP